MFLMLLILSAEVSLCQSRQRQVTEACQLLDAKLANGEMETEKSERLALDRAVDAIVAAKKIKRDLHRQ